MNLYNMMNGVSEAALYILPMLGKHPDMYPRFRDCFTSDNDHPEYNDHIHIYTRAGGGNRESYEDVIDVLQGHPDYVADWDDSYDCTYASYVFKVPERWKADYEHLKAGRMAEVSQEYREEMKRVYPKLAETIDSVFGLASKDQKPELGRQDSNVFEA